MIMRYIALETMLCPVRCLLGKSRNIKISQSITETEMRRLLPDSPLHAFDGSSGGWGQLDVIFMQVAFEPIDGEEVGAQHDSSSLRSKVGAGRQIARRTNGQFLERRDKCVLRPVRQSRIDRGGLSLEKDTENVWSATRNSA